MTTFGVEVLEYCTRIFTMESVVVLPLYFQVYGGLRYPKGPKSRGANHLPTIRRRWVLQLAAELRSLPESRDARRQVIKKVKVETRIEDERTEMEYTYPGIYRSIGRNFRDLLF